MWNQKYALSESQSDSCQINQVNRLTTDGKNKKSWGHPAVVPVRPHDICCHKYGQTNHDDPRSINGIFKVTFVKADAIAAHKRIWKNSIQENKVKGEDFAIPKRTWKNVIQENEVKWEELIP